MTWEVKKHGKFKNCVLIEGLPGIGNVGKIAADLLLEELKSKPGAEFFSYSMPNSVFVQENHLVELPRIEIRHVKHKKQDFLFLVGDVQPIDEVSSYEFTEEVLKYVKEQGCKEIITLGGIGLQEVPENPEVFCTGNDEKLVEGLAKNGANPKIYGKVGPIMGVSGLLLGLSKKKKIKAGALLSETLAHPMYIGLKGARALLSVLNKRYKFEISTKDLDREIKKVEEKIKQSLQGPASKEIGYIG